MELHDHNFEMAKKSFARNAWGVLQSVLVASLLYGFIYLTVVLFQRGSFPKSPADLYRNPSSNHRPGSSSSDSVGSGPGLPPSKLIIEKIKPSANWWNRPESLVVPKDDFLNKRPHVDTIANITKLVEECRGSYSHIEKMPYVQDCLKYMENGEKEYFYTPPPGERESEQPPKLAEYLNADGADNTLAVYPSYKPSTKDFIGQCNGPIVPLHTYWTGPATWRVELFLKSYFHTQNIPCSRLTIWLDSDRDKNAVEKMMVDPLFMRFLPFVELSLIHI